MMVTTHALFGAVLATVTLLLTPELGPDALPLVLLAGGVGGVVPDLDLYAGHRRTLHFPVYGLAVGLAALGVGLAVPSVATVSLAAFALGFGAHAAMDALGGGLELRPWEARSDRAVYSHYHRRWLRPRRWVRYDGAPEDVAVVALLAGVIAVAHPGPVAMTALAVLGLSAGYGLLRKPLAECWARLAQSMPPGLLPYLPERFTE